MSTERIDVEALRVPKEPTPEMVCAGFESPEWDALSDAVLAQRAWPYSCKESAECVAGIYRAMIAAAPAEVIERRARDAELIADLSQAIDDVKIVRRVDGDGMELGSIRKLANVERSLAAALAAIQGAQP